VKVRWLVIAALAACGGGDGDGGSGEAFLGVYSVTSHRYNVGPGGGVPISCGDAGDEVTNGDPFISFIVDPFFEDPDLLRMQECEAVGGPCFDEIGLFEPGGPGLEWTSHNTQTGGCVTSCCLFASRGRVTLTGENLHVEILHWNVSNDLPESQCTLDEAEALRDTDDCYMVEVWDATRLMR
jgi:hypothetical protein